MVGVSVFSPRHDDPAYADTIDSQRLLITFVKSPKGFTMTTELRRWGSVATKLISEKVTTVSSVEEAVRQAVNIIQKFLKIWPETSKVTIMGDIGPAEILGADKKPNPYDEKENPFPEQLSADDAAPVLKKIKKARQLNADNESELTPICAKLQRGGGLSPDESAKVLILLARNEQLHEFRKNLVSGELYAKNPSAKTIRRHVMMGAVAVMTPTEQLMLAKMTALAKQGNPNAIKALAALKAQGYAVTMGATVPVAQIPGKPMTPAEQAKLAAIVVLAKQGNANALRALAQLRDAGYSVTMGSDVGWGISDAFSLAMKPITIPAKHLWAATKWTGRKLGITKGGSASPEQVRLGRLRAAQQRARAAQARARAADAQSEAEYRAQQQLAAAADAEADAADAEATAKEAAIQTAEAEYLPGQTDVEAEAASSSGTDTSGRTAPVITQLPDTPAPPTPTAVKLKAQRRALVAKKNPLAAKILAKSEEQSPAGMKLAASMELYKRAEKRKSKERKAVAMMIAKAKKGDKQALADVRALKAASVAVKAERSAGRKVAAVYAYRATTAKVVAARKRAEVAMSDKLVRRSRAHQLVKVAKIERRAAAGDKPCQLFVKKHVAKAKAGDKGSKKVVAALVQAKQVRTLTPTARDKKRMRAAQKMARRVARGDRRAIMQTRMVTAAAKHGNPNAKKSRKFLASAAARELALKTGAIVVPGAVVTGGLALKKKRAKQAADQKRLASVEAKLARGKPVAREEAQAAAKAAADTGDRAKAAELMTTATTLPSAGDELRRVATVAAAATAGNLKYQGSVENASRLAAAGDPAGIEAMGKLAGVKALNDVSTGRPLDPAMKTVVQDIEKAQAGDPAAVEKIASMQTQAAAKSPEAIKYMVAATGAAVVARALANNPAAQEEWKEKAGVKPRTDTENDPVVVDAEIVTPGMSSLPDEPLPPVRGVVGFFKAALSAVALATKDPFQNYREGVASRARRLGPVSSTGATFTPEEDGHFISLRSKFLTAYNDAYETGKTFKNPLNNQDMIWLYKMHEREAKDLTHKLTSTYYAEEFLKEIDSCLKKLREKGIPISGETPSSKMKGDDKKPSPKKEDEGKYAVHTKKDPGDKEYEVHGDARSNDSKSTVFNYDQPDELYWPGTLTKERVVTMKARAGNGDKLAQQALAELRAKHGAAKLDSLKGDAPSDTAARDKLVADTKTRLTALVNAATAGDKKAQAKWDLARANYAKAKARAAKGDAKAKDVVSVLEATGLFTK
jgi:hypothetical protein